MLNHTFAMQVYVPDSPLAQVSLQQTKPEVQERFWGGSPMVCEPCFVLEQDNPQDSGIYILNTFCLDQLLEIAHFSLN